MIEDGFEDPIFDLSNIDRDSILGKSLTAFFTVLTYGVLIITPIMGVVLVIKMFL